MATTNNARSKRPIKVLLLLHELSLTGAPITVLNALEFLRADVEVQILAPHSGPLLELCRGIGPVTLIAPMLEAHNIVARIRRKSAVTRLERSIASWCPDVIYVNSVAALKLTQSLHLPEAAPILMHVHELEVVTRFLLRGITGLFCTLPSRYIAVSAAVERMLTEDYGIDPSRITRIPEIISASFAAQAKREKQAARGSIIVGGAGSGTVRKGILLWLQMASELLRLVGTDSIRFQWVGVSDSVEDQFYANIAEKMGIGAYVEFVTATADPGSLYRNFDVFAMTSWEDPCPLVVFENMALGVPVVCFAGGGGAPEQVGKTGMVVDDFSPLKMAGCIAGLVRDHDELARLGAAAAARYQDFYAIDVVGPRLFEELANLCSS